MSWLVDNAKSLYLVLGILAAALVLTWRFHRRTVFLGYAAGVLALMGLLWLLSIFVDTDSKQLEHSVNAMAQAVAEGKPDNLVKYISSDFRYKTRDRDALLKAAQTAVRDHKVREVRITRFRVEELSREKKFARTSYTVSVWWGEHENPYLFGNQADFVLEGAQWKLKTLRFYGAFADQDREIDLPIPN